MTRAATFLRSLASSWLSLVVVTGIQLIQIPVALKHLGEEEFGLFVVLSQTLGMLLLAQLGVTEAFARLLIDARTEGKTQYATMWCSGLVLFLIQATVVAVLTVGVAPFLDAILHLPPRLVSQATWLFLAAGAITVVQYPLNIYSLALFAGQRLATINMISIWTSLIQFGVFIGALYAGCGLWSYILGTAISTAAGILWKRWACERLSLAVRFERSLIDHRLIRSIFLFGTDVFFVGAYNFILNGGLLFFSGVLFPLDVTARLAVNLKLAQMVIQVLHRIVASTEPTLMEMVSKEEGSRFRFVWSCMSKAALMSSVATCGILYLLGGTLVRWWTSDPTMMLSGGPLALVALLPLRHMVQHLFVTGLVMFKQIGRVRWFISGEMAVFALLAMFLGREYGIVGLLVAQLISLPFGTLFPALRCFREAGEFEGGFLLRVLFRFAVVPVLLFFALSAVVPVNPARLTPALWASVGSWLLFTTAWTWWALTPSEETYLRQMAARLLTRLRPA